MFLNSRYGSYITNLFLTNNIIKLSNLTELILSHNQLKSIPESITNIPN